MVPQKLDVLLVEDNAVYALWLEKILHKECHEDGRKLTVSSVHSLFDAQQVADTKSVDAVLLDLSLPDSQ